MFIRIHNYVICRDDVLSHKGRVVLSDCKKSVELIEKDIVYLTGRKRVLARRKYFTRLKSCSKEYGLDDPIYLKESNKKQ